VERPRKSVLSAYLWLIALGVLGAHRFYLRRPGTGLAIALLFLAGPVLYLTGTDLDDKRLIFAALGAWALVISAVLADLAMNEPEAFRAVVKTAAEARASHSGAQTQAKAA